MDSFTPEEMKTANKWLTRAFIAGCALFVAGAVSSFVSHVPFGSSYESAHKADAFAMNAADVTVTADKARPPVQTALSTSQNVPN